MGNKIVFAVGIIFEMLLASSAVECQMKCNISRIEENTRETRGAGLGIFRVLPSSGLVEVKHNGQWGAVCDDYFGVYEARVLCRSLGYRSGYVIQGSYRSRFSFLLDDVQCIGNESSLLQCRHLPWGMHNCVSSEALHVRCQYSIEPEVGSARLVGRRRHSGRVEVFFDDTWGTICDDYFDDLDAGVVCRSMGLSGGRKIQHDSSVARASGPIWLDDIRCDGTEALISDCEHRGLGISDCFHHEDVFVSCGPPLNIGVRLKGGSNEKEGRVEILHNSKWGSVCDDNFSDIEAVVVCKSLNYEYEHLNNQANSCKRALDYQNNYIGMCRAGKAKRESFFGPGLGPIWLDGVQCNGSETSLVECPHDDWGVSDCSHYEDAGVVCWDEVDLSSMAEFRIIDGPSSGHGRLEILYDGQWGVICSQGFGQEEAAVACRHMGYRFGFVSQGRNISAADTVVVTINDCTGTEQTLFDCGTIEWMDAGCYTSASLVTHCVDELVTTYPDMQLALNTSVSLIDGPERGKCIAMMDTRHRSGTLCSEYFSDAAALVLCRSLGFRYGSKVPTSRYGPGEGFILLIDFNCTGDEPFLEACSHVIRQGQCSHNENVNIECVDILPGDTSSMEHLQMSIRLMDSYLPGSGRLEVWAGREWGTVCGDGFSDDEALVVCRSLGYRHGYPRLQSFHGQGSGLIHLSEVSCHGNETDIWQCSYNLNTQCSHIQDVGVRCFNETFETNNEDGTLRIINGARNGSGRVEVFFDGEWGTVCSDGFSDEEAEVVCRALGFSNGISRLGGFYGKGPGPIWRKHFLYHNFANIIDLTRTMINI